MFLQYITCIGGWFSVAGFEWSASVGDGVWLWSRWEGSCPASGPQYARAQAGGAAAGVRLYTAAACNAHTGESVEIIRSHQSKLAGLLLVLLASDSGDCCVPTRLIGGWFVRTRLIGDLFVMTRLIGDWFVRTRLIGGRLDVFVRIRLIGGWFVRTRLIGGWFVRTRLIRDVFVRYSSDWWTTGRVC